MVGPPAEVGDEVDEFGVGLQADDLAGAGAQRGQLYWYLVAGDDVGVGVGQCQQLGQVGVFGDSGDGPKFGSGGVDFDAGVGGGERGRPVTEVGDACRLEQVGA